MIFFRKWSEKVYFARRDGEIRFYPLGGLGPGWVVEESQVPHLEHCLTGFSLGGIGVATLWLVTLGHTPGLQNYGYLWAGWAAIYVIYWAAAWLCARKPNGGIIRVPDEITLRDKALALSPALVGLSIGCNGFMAGAGAIAFVVMIVMSLLGLEPASFPKFFTVGIGVLFFGFMFSRMRRIGRLQKQLGPHAETKAVFD